MIKIDCTTCINKNSPYKRGYYRVMTEKPDELFCYATLDQAIKAEKQIVKYFNSPQARSDMRKEIKWLKSQEGCL